MATINAIVTLTQVGQPGLDRLYEPRYKNVAPRVSASWDPFGKGQTVIRSGFGVFFDSYSQDVFLSHLPYNSSFDPGPAYNPVGPAPIFSVSAVGGTIQSGQPVFNAPSATPAGDVFSVDRNSSTPYLMNFNLNVQQQLSPRALAQIGYVGSVGRHLLRFRDINQPNQATITATDIAFAQANTYTDPVTNAALPCYPNGAPAAFPLTTQRAESMPIIRTAPSTSTRRKHRLSQATTRFSQVCASMTCTALPAS